MRKSKISPKIVKESPKKPTQILLDECFILCASGKGCDSTQCTDQLENREENALFAIVMARQSQVSLVLDEAEQVVVFYRKKYNLMSHTVMKILKRWLEGHNRQVVYYKPAKLNPKAIKECNLKSDKLDPLLCQLAIACGGDAPIWTLDSDFWCAQKFHAEIKPVCPQAALASVR